MADKTILLSLASASIFAIASSHSIAQEFNTKNEENIPAMGDILVTATRQSESLSKVPVSVAAFDADTMQAIGAKQIDDLVGQTPGLQINRSANGSNQISIRGISSSAGAGTTGVYIDDTSIQVRNLGYGSGTAFPEIFDLERVEVLRGPQGTLFGAGSEGGTVRFIQTAPNMRNWSGMARERAAARSPYMPMMRVLISRASVKCPSRVSEELISDAKNKPNCGDRSGCLEACDKKASASTAGPRRSAPHSSKNVARSKIRALKTRRRGQNGECATAVK